MFLLLRTSGDILLWKLPTECDPTCPQIGLDSSDILREPRECTKPGSVMLCVP